MTKVRWVTAVVFAVLIGFGIVLAVALGHDPTAQASPLVGKPAPEFSLTTFDGAQFRLADQRGKVVIVNWWNEWCEPCIAEQPVLDALAHDISGDSQVEMLGIAHEERSKRAARDYAVAKKITYPLAFDPGGQVALDWGVTQQPETFVVDPQGVVVGWTAGPLDVRAAENAVEQALGRPITPPSNASTSGTTP